MKTVQQGAATAVREQNVVFGKPQVREATVFATKSTGKPRPSVAWSTDHLLLATALCCIRNACSECVGNMATGAVYIPI